VQADEQVQGDELVDCCFHTLTSLVDLFSCVKHEGFNFDATPARRPYGPRNGQAGVPFTPLQKEFGRNGAELFEIFLTGLISTIPKGSQRDCVESPGVGRLRATLDYSLSAPPLRKRY